MKHSLLYESLYSVEENAEQCQDRQPKKVSFILHGLIVIYLNYHSQCRPTELRCGWVGYEKRTLTKPVADESTASSDCNADDIPVYITYL